MKNHIKKAWCTLEALLARSLPTMMDCAQGQKLTGPKLRSLCLHQSIRPSIHPNLHPRRQPRRRPLSYLSRRLDSLPDAEVDNGEDEEQAEGQLPADRAQLVQTRGEVDLQHLPTADREGGREGGWR